MKLSGRLVAILVVLLVVIEGGAYLYVPRGDGLSAAVAATLSVLNTDISAQRGGAGSFATALDGDLYKTGDVVRSSKDGRAVLTFFDGYADGRPRLARPRDDAEPPRGRGHPAHDRA